MLGMKTYPAEYVAQCRVLVRSDIDVFETSKVSADLEPVFFRNMLFALDGYFVHRLRTLEGKDGNALNEVRVMCNSVMLHGGVMTAEKSINLSPEASVLGIPYGEKIVLDAASFRRLSDNFFREIEAKYHE